MPMKLLSADDFRDAAKAGQHPDGTLFKFATTEPETVGEASARTKRFVFSDATLDHSSDTIDPKGWNLKVFDRNPVALFSHMSWDPPIGRASNVGVKNKALVGDIEFASADVYAFADTIFRLVDGGFLKAVSVGFKPDKWNFSSDKDRPYGIDFKEQTLLEISVCPVPCNPNALSEARSLGVDTRPLVEWAEKVLDSGETVFLPRKDLEALRGQAGALERRFYVSASRAISAAEVESIGNAVKGWRADPDAVLVLPEGFTLRSVGDEPAPAEATENTETADPADEHADPLVPDPEKDAPAAVEKAGRRISAATRSALETAMGHHAEMGKCIKDLMGDGDGPDDEQDGDEPEEKADLVIEDDIENLTPEQRRLKEAKALKDSLTPND